MKKHSLFSNLLFLLIFACIISSSTDHLRTALIPRQYRCCKIETHFILESILNIIRTKGCLINYHNLWSSALKDMYMFEKLPLAACILIQDISRFKILVMKKMKAIDPWSYIHFSMLTTDKSKKSWKKSLVRL